MAISIRYLEEAAAGGWRAPEETRLGGWLLRAAGGFTGRANSVLATGDPGIPLADAIAEAGRWYADLDTEPDEQWLARYRFRGRPLPPIGRRLLLSAPWQRFASAREAGRTIAVGRVAVAGGWAGLTAVEVDPAHRRRGLGRAITGALAAAAVQHGAEGIYLQVLNDNAAARALYRQAGFADHHGYHYRVAPDSPPRR